MSVEASRKCGVCQCRYAPQLVNEASRKCGVCQCRYTPQLVKSYLGSWVCVECVRGLVGVFARDPEFNRRHQEEIAQEAYQEPATPRKPVQWAPGESTVVDDDYRGES